MKQNSAMVWTAASRRSSWDRVLKALVISPDRALEELNSDWTASQELADLLMRKYKLPFRDGHHFASEVVACRDPRHQAAGLSYAEARRIYAESQKDSKYGTELPMSEAEFRAALDRWPS